MNSIAPIAITCGEPAGIGPDIAAAAWRTLRQEIPMVWIGDPAHLPASIPHQEISEVDEVKNIFTNALPVLPIDFAAPRQPGFAQEAHAPGVVKAIEKAVTLAMGGIVSGICTAPIHKAALINGANFSYPGHTEFLAALAGDVPVVMMLACAELRVVPATIHIPLSEVPRSLTAEKLKQVLEVTHVGLKRDFNLNNPRIAVAGLNPHAGEDGKMGREEIEVIEPVLEQLRAEGLRIAGPQSADTMFHPAARVDYDVAVCMYHDQALIPIKTIDFSSGVNITLGLPFVRTSPDHGTAFDIAGTDRADPSSMIAAIKAAASIAQARAA